MVHNCLVENPPLMVLVRQQRLWLIIAWRAPAALETDTFAYRQQIARCMSVYSLSQGLRILPVFWRFKRLIEGETNVSRYCKLIQSVVE